MKLSFLKKKKYKHTMNSLLAEWRNGEGGYLHQKFAILMNRPFDDPKDAEDLCSALKHERANELDGEGDEYLKYMDDIDPAWFTIAWKMHRFDSHRVANVIRNKGLPELGKRLEHALSEEAEWLQESNALFPTYRCLNGRPNHFLFLISLSALLDGPNTIEYLCTAARHKKFETGNRLRSLASWPQVFACLSCPINSAYEVLERLRRPLPEGEVAEGFLEFSNELLRQTKSDFSHPFDTSDGILRLHQFTDREDDEPDHPFAMNVVDTLQYLEHEGRELLLTKLLNHGNENVRRAAREMSKRV